jgi:hypothetical protein
MQTKKEKEKEKSTSNEASWSKMLGNYEII